MGHGFGGLKRIFVCFANWLVLKMNDPKSWTLGILVFEKTQKFRFKHKFHWPGLKRDRPYSID